MTTPSCRENSPDSNGEIRLVLSGQTNMKYGFFLAFFSVSIFSLFLLENVKFSRNKALFSLAVLYAHQMLGLWLQ